MFWDDDHHLELALTTFNQSEVVPVPILDKY